MLAAAAAARAGAGYVRLVGEMAFASVPNAVVRSGGSAAEFLADGRIGAVAIGPGLGRSEGARVRLEQLLALSQPLVLDADALHLLGSEAAERLRQLDQPPILTPHAGEFDRMFQEVRGSKVEKARWAAVAACAVIVYKGSDTVVAAPDGRAAIAPPSSPWLATAGTGDVLTGIVAAMRARGLQAFEAACAGVWLHSRAAALAGPGMIADDLVQRLQASLAECT